MSVIVSSVFSFVCAGLVAYYSDVRVDPINLLEALPFLVITIGFDKVSSGNILMDKLSNIQYSQFH